MNNKEKYNRIFMELFQVEENKLDELKYQKSEGWDSIAHMNLVAQIEDEFDVMLDTEDIIDFSSYKKGLELLKKYDVEF